MVLWCSMNRAFSLKKNKARVRSSIKIRFHIKIMTPTSNIEQLVRQYFSDFAQLEVRGLLFFYAQLRNDPTPGRYELIQAGAALPDELNSFLGHYRKADYTTTPLTIRSICQNYLQMYSN